MTVPVNADATSGFGLQRRPLNESFDPSDPEAFVAAVEDMLSITIERSAVVDPAGLEALLEPLGPVQVVLPDAVIDTDAIDTGDQVFATTVPDDTVVNDTVPDDTLPDTTDPDSSVPDDGESQVVGDDGVIVTAGPQILETAQVVEVLTAIDESVPAYDQHPLDVAMWSAIAQLAPISVPPEPVTTDAQGSPVAPDTVGDLASLLFDGPVGVRDLAVSPSTAMTNPTDSDVVVLDRNDSVLVFAQISPSLVSTPNTGSKVRVEVSFTDDQLAQTDGLYETNSDVAREMVRLVLFLQGNVVSVDTSPSGAPEVTLVEVADPGTARGGQDDRRASVRPGRGAGGEHRARGRRPHRHSGAVVPRSGSLRGGEFERCERHRTRRVDTTRYRRGRWMTDMTDAGTDDTRRYGRRSCCVRGSHSVRHEGVECSRARRR